jgi:hypothetical protein
MEEREPLSFPSEIPSFPHYNPPFSLSLLASFTPPSPHPSLILLVSDEI